MQSSSRHVVVIGAGVIGLSTAIKIQERGGYSTTIVAEQFPEDIDHPERSAKYTSWWAGAMQTGFPEEGSLQHKITEETYRTMWDLSTPGSDAENCFLRAPLEYHTVENLVDEESSKAYRMPWYSDTKILPSPSGKGSIIQVNSLTVEPERYLPYLVARFRKAGGRTVRATIQDIHQLLGKGHDFPFDRVDIPVTGQGPSETGSPISQPNAIVVCAGLGARTLGGVQDDAVIPVRGQTVWIKAPWIKKAQMKEEEDGGETYVFPRRSGTVVLGGIYTPNDWYASPRQETKEDILRRTLKLCPELIQAETLETGQTPIATTDELKKLIIGEGCGLRPGRIGGLRLDVGWVDKDQHDIIEQKGATLSQKLSLSSSRVPVIYNYGHTGLGYSMSWGSASRALELLEEALA